jgi:hypothetical protein
MSEKTVSVTTSVLLYPHKGGDIIIYPTGTVTLSAVIKAKKGSRVDQANTIFLPLYSEPETPLWLSLVDENLCRARTLNDDNS